MWEEAQATESESRTMEWLNDARHSATAETQPLASNTVSSLSSTVCGRPGQQPLGVRWEWLRGLEGGLWVVSNRPGWCGWLALLSHQLIRPVQLSAASSRGG
jgi:hypothetical protein